MMWEREKLGKHFALLFVLTLYRSCDQRPSNDAGCEARFNTRLYVCLFIINPVGSMIHPNRQDKYSFDTNNLASVFLLTRSHRCVQQTSASRPARSSAFIGRRRVPSHITWHVHSLRTSPAQRPNPDHRTNDTRSTVYRLHYRPRPHCSSATVWVRSCRRVTQCRHTHSSK